MVVCVACGREVAANFRFCPHCGALVVAAVGQREQRKVVSVLFCDVTSSTALGERLDPEPLRELLARYFESMRAIVERHGGTVEKFVGDAVMAVFGVPVLHEDDALRAVRAAAEMLAAVGELGIQVRIGVNTGEVVAGTVERLATGDAVNVAARLEQAAAPGVALLGEETFGLVRGAVEVEPVEPLALKGKAEPVRAFRLVSVAEGPAVTRRFDRALVGRGRELRLLREAFELASSERACHLFTLLGAAGVGKTRLVQEFLAGVDARIVSGRCLSYGDGITYWPVVEVLKQLAPESVDELLDGRLATEEIAFRVRKLLEAGAEERPLVVVWDDLHWGEPTFLDLVEHVADWSRGAPILLLCMARPELLDLRAGWGGGKLNTTTLLLEPLPVSECGVLLDRLAPALESDLRARILRNADGNPLFVEEMVAMAEQAGGEVAVPPTIQALLAARIDQLRSEERSALECGAVEGQVFHRSAVQALAPEVGAHLLGLVRKELVRPERATLPGDDAFRFRHILIRDAAYEALPKAKRAELHERFADWLTENGTTLVELDEILGYHLEQAHRYRSELGRPDKGLGRRAAERLAVAGRAALERGDIPAATSLLGRALPLLAHHEPLRLELLADLGDAHYDAGRAPEAARVLREAFELAASTGGTHVADRAQLRRIRIAQQWTLEDDLEGVPRGVAAGLESIEQIVAAARKRGDERLVAWGQAIFARLTFFNGRCEEAGRAAREAIEAARRAGDYKVLRNATDWSAGIALHGPMPVEEARVLLAQLEAGGEATPDGILTACRGELEAMAGEFDAGRQLVEGARRGAADRGQALWQGGSAMFAARVELLAGDYESAERILREGWTSLGALGESGFRATVGGLLAEALIQLERMDEAEAVAREVLTIAYPDDWEPQARGRTALARVLVRRGRREEALRLVEEALALVEPTDYFPERGDAFAAAAEVFALAKRDTEAAAMRSAALATYERKGATAATRRLQDRLPA